MKKTTRDSNTRCIGQNDDGSQCGRLALDGGVCAAHESQRPAERQCAGIAAATGKRCRHVLPADCPGDRCQFHDDAAIERRAADRQKAQERREHERELAARAVSVPMIGGPLCGLACHFDEEPSPGRQLFTWHSYDYVYLYADGELVHTGESWPDEKALDAEIAQVLR